METISNMEREDKWETIKILRTLKEEIEREIQKRRRFSTVPEFTNYAIRKELDRQRAGSKN